MTSACLRYFTCCRKMSQESVRNPPVNLYTPTGDGSAVFFLQSECDIDPGAFVSLEAERQDIAKRFLLAYFYHLRDSLSRFII